MEDVARNLAGPVGVHTQASHVPGTDRDPEPTALLEWANFLDAKHLRALG